MGEEEGRTWRCGSLEIGEVWRDKGGRVGEGRPTGEERRVGGEWRRGRRGRGMIGREGQVGGWGINVHVRGVKGGKGGGFILTLRRVQVAYPGFRNPSWMSGHLGMLSDGTHLTTPPSPSPPSGGLGVGDDDGPAGERTA